MSSASASYERSARHVALPQIGAEGQAKIEAASALLIGLGGIGCAAAAYLASSGVGRLVVNDFDSVDETNLGRQFLYGPGDVGVAKTQAASERLSKMNPAVEICRIDERLDAKQLRDAIKEVDIVLDGCDNFATRFLVNEQCVALGKPLVSGSAIRFEGQLAVFGPDYEQSPCYRCLYSTADESLDDCAGNGVFSPVPGVIGVLMAAEALKAAAGLPHEIGKFQVFDALANEWRKITIEKSSRCDVCG